jgi:hypothetical protein
MYDGGGCTFQRERKFGIRSFKPHWYRIKERVLDKPEACY